MTFYPRFDFTIKFDLILFKLRVDFFSGGLIMNISYEEMEYFLSFAETGRLTETAEKYSISQPTLSRVMKKIEDEFCVPLFIRGKNKIELNENGKLAANEMKFVVKQTDEMFSKIRRFDKLNRI